MTEPVTHTATSQDREIASKRLLAGAGTTLLFVVAIVTGSLNGTISPSTGEALGGLVDYTVLFLVGLLIFEVDFTRFRPGRADARFLAIAWGANFIVVPAVGFAIASLFVSGQPLFFIGLVIYFMSPCTDWFLGFTRLARGNTALGTTLIPINMVSQLLLYPVFLHLFAGGAAPVGIEAIGEALLQWFLIPFVAAIVLHTGLRNILGATLFDHRVRWVSITIPFLIALLIIETFAGNIGVIVEHAGVFAVILVAIFVFFVVTFILGEIISRVAGLAHPEHALLTMTMAARNAPMMLGVSIIAMPDQPLFYATIIIGMLVEFPHLTGLRQILLRGNENGPADPLHETSPLPAR